MRTHNYRVSFRKRNTERILTGTYHDDGLSSLSPVTLDSGEVVYLSVLDTVLSREQIPGTGPGEYYLAGASEQRFA